ncbi:MAG: hypothetical protein ACPGED_11060, partial [Flavobacteriales bacterium]
GLKSIEQGVVFPSGQAWLKLDSSTFEKKDDQLNALVTLSFTDEFELLKLMNFNQTHFGKQTPSDEFHY